MASTSCSRPTAPQRDAVTEKTGQSAARGVIKHSKGPTLPDEADDLLAGRITDDAGADCGPPLPLNDLPGGGALPVRLTAEGEIVADAYGREEIDVPILDQRNVAALWTIAGEADPLLAAARAAAADLTRENCDALGALLADAQAQDDAAERAATPARAVGSIVAALEQATADPMRRGGALLAARIDLALARVAAGLDPELVLGAIPVDGLAIFAERPPTRWLCKALQWARGRPAQIQGYGGAGKTVVVMAAAVALLAGLPIWGCPALLGATDRPLRVIHLDYDQGEDATVLRYRRIALGMGLDPATFAIDPSTGAHRLRVASRPPVRLTSFAGGFNGSKIDREAAIAAYSRAVQGYDLAIVDALRGLVPGEDENDSRIRDYLDILGAVSENTGCTIVFLHHAGKGGHAKGAAARPETEHGRGSSAIHDGSGSVLLLAPDPDHAEMVEFKMVRDSALRNGPRMEGGFVQITDVAIGDDPSAGLAVRYVSAEAVAAEAPSKVDTKRRDLYRAILGAVKANPGATVAIVKGAVGGNSVAVSHAIEALLGPGLGAPLNDRPAPGARKGAKSLHLAQGVNPEGYEPPGAAARTSGRVGFVPCEHCGGTGTWKGTRAQGVCRRWAGRRQHRPGDPWIPEGTIGYEPRDLDAP